MRAEYRSVMQVFTKQNPYTEAWLAANHGNYDNIWTAEYETRLQQAAEPVLSDLLNVLNPNYGPDVRMSNGNVLGSNQNEFQIDVNPTNSLNAIGTSNDGQTAGVGIFRTTDGGLTWTSRDASFYGVPGRLLRPRRRLRPRRQSLRDHPRHQSGGHLHPHAPPTAAAPGPVPARSPPPTGRTLRLTQATRTSSTSPSPTSTSPPGRIAGYKSTDGGVTWGIGVPHRRPDLRRPATSNRASRA